MSVANERRGTIRFASASARRRATVLGIAAGTLTLLVTTFGSPATAGPGESDFASATTTLRAQNGLPAYRVCPDLTAVAQSWAAQMAAKNSLAHNPNIGTQVPNWRAYGENVGYGRTVTEIQGALVASPGHLGNLLSPRFTEVGYGTALSADGHLYVDEVFRTPLAGPCAGSAAAASAPTKTQAPSNNQQAPAGDNAPIAESPVTPPAPVVPDLNVALQRLTQPVEPSGHEDSIMRAFGFHQTFAAAVQS